MATALTAESFTSRVLEQTGVSFVDFWAEWCQPCRMMGPVVDELAGDFDGRAEIFKLDVDEYGALAAQYGVMNIPSMLIFKDGKEVGRLVGVQSKAAISEAIEKALG